MKRDAKLWAAAALALGCGNVSALATLTGPIYNSSTGHYYYLLDQASWTDAEAAAVSLGGHLATVNDASEQDWIYSTFRLFGDTNRHLWIGLYDADQTVNSAGTANRATRRTEFSWVSGEASGYANWSPYEPNSQFSGEINDAPPTWEFYGHIWDPTDAFAGYWNNYVDSDTLFGHPLNGVVEVNSLMPVPEPATLALFGLGLAGIPWARRRRTPA